jgi:sterol desaturase/sphingolipid hydroxylase (fatty acid hydroxylase superfamily)
MSDSGETTFQLARAVALVAALALGLALEGWRPHARLRPAWATNAGLWVIDTAVMTALCGACGWTVASWGYGRGYGLLAWAGGGWWLAAALGVIALDAVSYVWHRANHSLSLLWRFHQVHHGDASFHVTTALRFHPGELVLALPVRIVAILALGVPPEGVLVFELVFGTANLLEHGNFDLPRRAEEIVRRALVTPTLHRSHHAAKWAELDTNFGTIFSVWDRFAGTFRGANPASRQATGLPDRSQPTPASPGDWLVLPFTASAGRRPGSRA